MKALPPWRNPRWWLALPLLLPVAAFFLAVSMVHKPLWWLGQAICELSNFGSPHNPGMPRAIEKLHGWVSRGAHQRPTTGAARQ